MDKPEESAAGNSRGQRERGSQAETEPYTTYGNSIMTAHDLDVGLEARRLAEDVSWAPLSSGTRSEDTCTGTALLQDGEQEGGRADHGIVSALQ